jgi:hypothetical protein
MINQIEKLMDGVKLITLSLKANFHFISISPAAFMSAEDIEALSPADKEKLKEADMKVMVSKGSTIGFIVDKILYVKPEFFTGGKFHTVFLDNEFTIARETFKLNGVQAIPHDTVSKELLSELLILEKKSQTEPNPDNLKEMADRAAEIAEQLESDQSKKLLNNINTNLKNALDAVIDTEGELINKISANIKQMANSDDKNEVLTLYNATKAMIKKAPDTEELQSEVMYMEKIYAAKVKEPKSKKK